MTRKYSSTSVATTLAAGINSSTTTITVATGTGSALMGGATLAAGNVDQFTVAIDVDTINEEIVFVTAISSDTLTVVRARAGTTGIAHTAGASIKHVLTSDDLTFYTTGVATANAAVPQSTATAKGDVLVATAAGAVSKVAVGTNDHILTADSTTATGVKWAAAPVAAGTVTLTGTQTLTNKTLTAPVLTAPVVVSPEERTTVSATAATGTINFDVNTQGTLYYTTNASGNWTLNVRGDSGTSLNSIMAVGDSITITFLATQGTTAYYASALTIDSISVTPKYQGGTAFAAGNASSIDAYTYAIVKTGSAAYTVFASQTKFA